MFRRRLLAAILVATALCVGPLALSVSAHVNVTSSSTKQGQEAVLTFRVPTEKDVPTTKFEVALPTDTPIMQVSVQPKAGWTYELARGTPVTAVKDSSGNPVTKVVTRVTWTATGAGIKPGEYDQFTLLADPLPDSPQLVFKALQTYSDGSVVSWIQLPVAGSAEPEFPAPILTLGPDTTDPVVRAAPTVGATTDPSGGDTVWKVLAIVALVLGALALLGAAYAVRRATSRRTSGAAFQQQARLRT